MARRMAPPRRGEARRRHGRRLPLLVLVLLAGLQSTAIGVADEPTVEPTETAGEFAWKPSAVTAAPGGTVAFRNPGDLVPHGVRWTGGPEKPSCSGVPVDSSGTAWSGTCAFIQAGTYTFVCTVHPEEMKGMITVASGETPATPAPAPAPGQPPAPSEGPLVEALRLAKSQHGRTVRGSIAVSSAAIGGRLEVELRASRTALGGRGKGMARVGAISRSLAGSGRQAFAVRLRPPAQRALERRGHLSLVVKAAISAPSGTTATMTRRVKLNE
jgi:plastocyanin